jgi:hypothetical protein
MNWDQVVGNITPHVVQLDTPDRSGTGFLCLYNDNHQWAGIATAAHVVHLAEQQQQPIRILASTKNTLLPPDQRIIFLDTAADAAVLLVPNSLGFPQKLVPLLPSSVSLPVGSSVGWVGFPSVAKNTLCFFAGTISAVETAATLRYLIDGVAINGVSGGPILHIDSASNEPHIVGILISTIH